MRFPGESYYPDEPGFRFQIQSTTHIGVVKHFFEIFLFFFRFFFDIPWADLTEKRDFITDYDIKYRMGINGGGGDEEDE